MTDTMMIETKDEAGDTNTERAFDYTVEAELYPPRHRNHAGRQFRYTRFAQAADAIRFAIEALPPAVLSGAIIEAGETRLDAKRIRQLYDSSSYPLARDEKRCVAAV